MAIRDNRIGTLRRIYWVVQSAALLAVVLGVVMSILLASAGVPMSQIAVQFTQPEELHGMAGTFYELADIAMTVAVLGFLWFVTIIRSELQKAGRYDIGAFGTSFWWLWLVVPIANVIVPPLCIFRTLGAVEEPPGHGSFDRGGTLALVAIWWAAVAVVIVEFGVFRFSINGHGLVASRPALGCVAFMIGLLLLMVVMRRLMHGFERMPTAAAEVFN